MNDYLKRPMTEEEDKYTFRQSNQISGQTGLIGYLRADFGRDGNEFYSSWEDWNNNLKTPDFKQELDEVINCLREEGDILSGRAAMSRYCNDTPQSKMTKESYFYGVRVDTDKYAYLLRMNLNKGDYNLYEFLDTPLWARWNIKVHFSQYSGEWNVEGKSYDRGNVKAYNTYGTSRINAYKIIEETLNLKDVRIFDYIEDDEGKKKAVLNKKETAIAQSKQELIKQGFQDWIWADPTRREKLTKLYNEKFNSIRPREYDGSHITFSGMNPEIELREHQKNAVAHILYGGNTLLAHAVGAGKTYEMVAAAQESKRLGLCNKSLFVVPNHLTEQWAAEYLQLYPSANILVATKKDFETKNRKKFCGRIATGDYDAIIIGHSQFEKIPMSIERQRSGGRKRRQYAENYKRRA